MPLQALQLQLDLEPLVLPEQSKKSVYLIMAPVTSAKTVFTYILVRAPFKCNMGTLECNMGSYSGVERLIQQKVELNAV